MIAGWKIVGVRNEQQEEKSGYVVSSVDWAWDDENLKQGSGSEEKRVKGLLGEMVQEDRTG